jgi:CRP/FNR family transcriptional regulator, cyclic AMP receptor protein
VESLLAALDPAPRSGVLKVAVRRRFARGEVVFHEGDPGDALHVVTAGVFLARTSSPRGDVVAVNVLCEGMVFGELALLTETYRRSATVVALRAASTLMLTRGDFEDLRRREPKVDRLLVAVLADRNRRLNDQLMELVFTPVQERVYRRLLAFAGAVGDGARPGWLDLSQGELAALAGTTRPTVNRALRRAERQGLVELARGRVRIVDAAALARLGG